MYFFKFKCVALYPLLVLYETNRLFTDSNLNFHNLKLAFPLNSAFLALVWSGATVPFGKLVSMGDAYQKCGMLTKCLPMVTRRLPSDIRC